MSSREPEPRIRILPDDVAAKIAAGEVVERPASVVKELVENALDSGATRVAVEVQEGGRRLIRVEDNGCGMTAQELVLCLQRHATSKITSLADLDAIRTLGFRGEAMPSIASVCRMVIVSRTPGSDEALRLEANEGQVESLEPVAAPEGTSVSVFDLFAPLPARRKFLKSDRVELARVCDVVMHAALSRPGAGLKLSADGGDVLHSPGSPDPLNTVAALWGAAVARELRPVQHSSGSVTVEGYVGSPQLTRPTRSGQHLFVNGRWVRDRTIWHALDDAYKGHIVSGRHPVVLLHLEVDPAAVDVNVHPTKMEVRFLRSWEVHRAVRDAVQQALSGGGAAEAGPALRERILAPAEAASTPWLGSQMPAAGGSSPAPSSSAHPLHPLPAAPTPAPTDAPGAPAGAGSPHSIAPPGTAARPSPAPTLGLELPEAPPRVVAQLFKSFILAEGQTGILLYDQHLVHERVLYEQVLAQSRPRPLLQPASVQLSSRQAMAVEEALPALQGLGFAIEPFGAGAFLVRALPETVAPGRLEGRLPELLELVAEETAAGGDGERLRLKLAAATACRSAVRKGTELGRQEMEQLLRDFARVNVPATCPHGCPIMVELSYTELLKRFHRT